jgi:hypothetical protein
MQLRQCWGLFCPNSRAGVQRKGSSNRLQAVEKDNFSTLWNTYTTTEVRV